MEIPGAMPATTGRGKANLRRGRLATAAASATGALTDAVLDLGDGAVRGVEELRVDLGPATERVDGEQARGSRELRLVQIRSHDRAVALAREDLLRRVGVEELHEVVREGRIGGVARD